MRTMKAVHAVLVAVIVATAPLAQDSASPPPVVRALEHVTLFVPDQEQALRWYVDRLGLVKVEDQRFGAGERWLTVAPPGEHATRIVLAVPREALRSSIGHQHNWVFRTGDCEETHARLTAKGVKYIQPPSRVPWGCQAIVEDPFGNRIVLLAR
jgi:predicted enzyme related to lactoylglutathione lyase